jgi:DNA-directed RNA polymerase specialized sigma24 family protein
MSPEQELLTTDLRAQLERIESILQMLVERQQVKEWYSTSEAANLLGVSPWTVREWCRLGRCHAKKKHSGRGAHPSWTVSQEEILRIQRDGLLPLNTEHRKDD